MIIFKDTITGDEMFTDTYRMKLVDDCVYEVTCKHISRKVGEVTLDGANPSAEEADEGTDDAMESGLDLVLNQRLVESSFDKTSYKAYLKTYTKALQEKWKELEYSADKIGELKTKCMTGVKKLLTKLDDAQFFLGESMNPDGLVAVLEYRDGAGDDGGEAAIMLFLSAGIDQEKC